MLRIVAGLVLALMLGACGQTTIQNMSSMGTQGLARPETVVVSDFSFSSDVVLLDRGFAAQLQRKMGKASPEQIREQLAARVSREIVTAMVTTLREAGLDARAEGEEEVVADRAALVVAGKVRAIDQGNRTRRNVIGFGAGKSEVVADVVVVHDSQGVKKDVLTFTAETGSGRRPGGAVTAPLGAARGVAAVAGVASEKLSADVEAEARRLGQTAARRIIAFGAQQGWLPKPGT
jgi:hypothetical protein